MIKKVAALLILSVAGSAPLVGGTPAEFSIDWYTIDGGGGTSTGGVFSLTGTIGQHDASPATAQGGAFSLSGGFWGGGLLEVDILFRDGFENP
ncbi:MAG: hypothetical protein R3212_06490 [Xanthomonadales bacterium]|nr:hypothetical protein [Xanthomonadales bacterium]